MQSNKNMHARSHHEKLKPPKHGDQTVKSNLLIHNLDTINHVTTSNHVINREITSCRALILILEKFCLR